MGKDKGKGQFQRKSNYTNKEAHEPTAMELAFLQAKALREKAPAVSKNTAGQPAPKRVETTADTQPKMIPKVLSVPTESIKSKPPAQASAASSVKKGPVVQQHSGKSCPSKSVTSHPKKTMPVKLGLKRIEEKTFVLNSELQQETTPSSSGKHRSETKVGEGRTQVHNGTYNDEIDIVMGFDFGTSSSKVIVRDSVRRTAYAFPFGSHASTGNIYLIPTQLYISDDGTISLSTGAHSCGSIKSRMMVAPNHVVFSLKNAQSITVTEIAAGYMAQVIRFARAWFLTHTESIYKKTHIHWHINMGMPSRNYDNEEMRELFRVIAMAAWRISLLPLPITIIQVKEYIEEARRYIVANDKVALPEDVKTLWLHPDYVNAHPEVIMEVVGYARSPLRTNGLHLIVDVGATTLDAATFIIHNSEGDNMFPILETAVERLGTLMLHSNRLHAVKAAMERSLQKMAAIDPILPLPDLNHYAIGDQNAEIGEGDERFFTECCRMIGQTIKDTKDHRDPYSSIWGTELPVFICGGGGRLPSYRQMITEMGARCAQSWKVFRGFSVKKIPKPDELQAPDLSLKEYDRLAVAYGLSFTSDEIGEVIRQSEISNIARRDNKADIEELFVSKDMC